MHCVQILCHEYVTIFKMILCSIRAAKTGLPKTALLLTFRIQPWKAKRAEVDKHLSLSITSSLQMAQAPSQHRNLIVVGLLTL